jgi:hypothetical protein
MRCGQRLIPEPAQRSLSRIQADCVSVPSTIAASSRSRSRCASICLNRRQVKQLELIGRWGGVGRAGHLGLGQGNASTRCIESPDFVGVSLPCTLRNVLCLWETAEILPSSCRRERAYIAFATRKTHHTKSRVFASTTIFS